MVSLIAGFILIYFQRGFLSLKIFDLYYADFLLDFYLNFALI